MLKAGAARAQTLETEGQMLQRVMPGLMGMKNIVVLNDEAHHCYRERVQDAEGETEADLKGEEKDEAKENNEAARMWISGIETVKRKLGVSLVYDLRRRRSSCAAPAIARARCSPGRSAISR